MGSMGQSVTGSVEVKRRCGDGSGGGKRKHFFYLCDPWLDMSGFRDSYSK